MKCFEINVLIINHENKQMKEARQYFHQPAGAFQAIQDTLKWLNIQSNRKFKDCVIDRLIIWEWDIAIPSKDGEIKTKKHHRILDWSFEKGISQLTNISNKQKKKVLDSAKVLNKFRHIKAEILIEEIGQELLTEGVTCIAI